MVPFVTVTQMGKGISGSWEQHEQGNGAPGVNLLSHLGSLPISVRAQKGLS
jgi:hypothetical protein